ncbi:MAG: hypothetical protein DWQ05_04045 [Calditrichaeota bacterium]|nr:MAG: hypothetical protein DWQ05_04045 [Calditrichota bacterium]
MYPKSPKQIFLIINLLSFLWAFSSLAQTINNVPVQTKTGEQTVPQSVAVGADAFIVWIDSGVGGDKIEFMKLTSIGMPDSSTKGELGVPSARIRHFDLASESDESFFIAWDSFQGNQYAVNITKIDKNGLFLWDAPVQFTENALNFRMPYITPDFADGVYVVWQQSAQASGDNPDDIDLYGQHLDANGDKKWGSKNLIINKKGKQILGEIVASQQALVVAWEDVDSRDVRLGAYDVNSGAALAGEDGIAPGSGVSLYNPKLIQVKASATDVRDAVIVVWEEAGIFGTNKNIYAQEIDLQGNSQWSSGGEPVSITSSDPRLPQIFSDEQRGVIVVWQEHALTLRGIYAQRLDRNGDRLWGGSGVKLVGASGYNAPFKVVHDKSQGVYLTWADAGSGDFDIWAHYLNKDQKMIWGNTGKFISQHSNDQTQPFAVSFGDELLVTWQDDRAGNNDIYAQTILKSGELVNLAPVIYSQPVVDGVAGNNYAYQIVAADIDMDIPLSYAMTSGPDWLSVDAAGLLSGITPVKPGTTIAIIELEVADFRGATAEQSFKLTINSNNNPPQFTSDPVIEVNEDATYEYFPIVEDTDGDSIRIEAITTPAWLSFDTSKAVLQGVPLNENVGDTVVVLRAIDAFGAFDEQSFKLTVLNTNDAPTITSTAPPATVFEDSLYSFLVTADDEDAGDQLSFSLRKAPQWLKIDAVAGLLSGRPAAEHVGTDSVIVVVSDLAGATAELGFNLTVTNTNDAPEFISVPITSAFVNIQYQYNINVVDPDSGDVVTLSLQKSPSWLELVENILQGVPPASANGSLDSVVVRAEDNIGSFAVQLFQIEVSDIPDTVAPAAMLEAFVANSQWTTVDSFVVKWKMPADSGSEIKTLYVKYGTPPTDSLDFDSQLLFTNSGEFLETRITPTLQGRVPFYCWLADAAGNHDFHTAVALEYRLDRTAPLPAKPVFPDAWARADTLVFKWIAATDTVSGIEKYEIHLDTGENMTFPVETFSSAGDTLSASFAVQLEGKLFHWYVDAADSSGNRVSSTPLFFTIDAVKPFLQHGLIQSAPATDDLEFIAHVTDGISGVGRVALMYRLPGQSFSEVEMTGSGTNSETFKYILAAALMNTTGLEYTIYADDQAGNRAWLEEPNTGLNYKSVAIASTGNVAPKSLKNQYQLVSIPFELTDGLPLSFFETTFGKHDDTEWRILKYLNENYIEINDAAFTSLQPGHGFWLITRSEKAWKTAAVRSVPTDKVAEIALNPGWNIVGSPWAWAVNSEAITIPEGVENALWQWDNGYSLANTGLEPWRGYFINNGTQEVQKLKIDITNKTSIAKTKPHIQNGTHDWVLQLSVNSGQFKDESNFFGVSQTALMASEPPEFSKAPRLYFKEKNQQNPLAVAIRDQVEATNSWNIRVDNLQPGMVEFHLKEMQALPDSFTAVILDHEAGISRKFAAKTPYQFRVISEGDSRSFTIEVGPENQVNSALVPAKLTLENTWPNPFRLSEGGQVRIRFSVPREADVELRIFNILGQVVWQSSFEGSFSPGKHAVMWDGRAHSGRPLASGVYFMKMFDGVEIAQKKMILVR